MTGMWAVCVAVGVLGSGAARAGTKLITEEEAKLPPPKGAVAADRRGILRGPKIDFVSPAEPVRSPVHLQPKFESFAVPKIYPTSIKPLYLHPPTVDMTPRFQ